MKETSITELLDACREKKTAKHYKEALAILNEIMMRNDLNRATEFDFYTTDIEFLKQDIFDDIEDDFNTGLNPEKALSDIELYLLYKPDNHFALSRRLTIYIEQKRYSEALSIINDLIPDDCRIPDEALLSQRSEIHHFLGQFDEAIADLNFIIGLNERYSHEQFVYRTIPYRMRLATIYHEIKRDSQALICINFILTHDKEHLEALKLHRILTKKKEEKIIDEFKIHKLNLKQGQAVPSLQDFCKYTIFRHSNVIKEQITQISPEFRCSDYIENVLNLAGINKLSLSTIQKHLNLTSNETTLFDTLQALKVQELTEENHQLKAQVERLTKQLQMEDDSPTQMEVTKSYAEQTILLFKALEKGKHDKAEQEQDKFKRRRTV